MEIISYTESGAYDRRRLRDALIREEISSWYDSEEDSDDECIRNDPIRYSMSVWLAELDDATDDVPEIPPAFIVHYRDLLEKGWGWQRLVPYIHGNVDWTIFKGYLKEFFIQNAGEIAALWANKKPEKDKDYFCRITSDVTVKDKAIYSRNVSRFILGAVAEMCVEIENHFRLIHHHLLTAEDFILSHQIEERANYVIQSAGECYSNATAAALVCIVKENDLLFELFDWRFGATEMINFSKKVSQSAFNLMLYEGLESDAAAGAMVGLVKEAKFLCYVMSREDRFVDRDYYCCNNIRSGTARALHMLCQESSSETSNGGHVSCASSDAKSEKPRALMLI